MGILPLALPKRPELHFARYLSHQALHDSFLLSHEVVTTPFICLPLVDSPANPTIMGLAAPSARKMGGFVSVNTRFAYAGTGIPATGKVCITCLRFSSSLILYARITLASYCSQNNISAGVKADAF